MLEDLKHLHPLPAIILEYRSMGKLLAEVEEIRRILQEASRSTEAQARVGPVFGSCSHSAG